MTTTYQLDATEPLKTNAIQPLWHRAIKRAFDIIIAALGLFLLAPFFLLVIILLKREAPGPLFYRGKRAGRNGRAFGILKFRTMLDTPQNANAPRVTAKDDERITPLGHWLRDTKINELPQLWNVLIGEMSMVGPRPEDFDIATEWSQNARAEILSVRPGITSPASIIYRDEENLLSGQDFMTAYYQNILPDKMRLDRIYVRHHNLLGDIDILFWTAAALLPRLARTKILEGDLFGGPISRFVRFNISWLMIDFLVAFISAGLVGAIWRSTGPINLGLPRALLIAVETAFAFGIINALLGLNSVAWDRAVPEDGFGIIVSSAIVITLIGFYHYFILPAPELPVPVLLFTGILAALGFISARYRLRILTDLSAFWTSRRGALSSGERVLIVGMGEGSEFANWILRRDRFRRAFTIIGIIDEDPLTQGMRYDGAWVIGTSADIAQVVKKYDVGLIMLAASNAPIEDRQRITEACIETNLRIVLISDLMRALQRWLKQTESMTTPRSY